MSSEFDGQQWSLDKVKQGLCFLACEEALKAVQCFSCIGLRGYIDKAFLTENGNCDYKLRYRPTNGVGLVLELFGGVLFVVAVAFTDEYKRNPLGTKSLTLNNVVARLTLVGRELVDQVNTLDQSMLMIDGTLKAIVHSMGSQNMNGFALGLRVDK